MDLSALRKEFNNTNLNEMIGALIIGLAIGETFYFSQKAAAFINPLIIQNYLQVIVLVICATNALILLIYLFFIRECHLYAMRLYQSKRFELAVTFLIGIIISILFSGIGSEYYAPIVEKISPRVYILLSATPLLVSISIFIKFLLLSGKNNTQSSFFLDDKEISSKNDDILGFSNKAEIFASSVLNNNSPSSLTFGLDAPWGTGKSSFLNLCTNQWEASGPSQCIVFKFEPLRYGIGSDLRNIFTRELVKAIKNHFYLPSLNSGLTKYVKLLQETNASSFLNPDFLSQTTDSKTEDAYNKLESILSNTNKKLIVVVDDLDRIDWKDIKEILFSIKRSFMLPNISYVICYDTNKLPLYNKTNNDEEYVRNFLEKFIDVKMSIYLGTPDLSDFVSVNFKKASKNNLLMDSATKGLVENMISELKKIYTSNDYHIYSNLIGDIRKIKRLINTVILFKLETVDYTENDFDRLDLIHLLLIYINFPATFRVIYNSETFGKKGIFSVQQKIDSTDFFNDPDYLEFKGSAGKLEAFLIDKLFSAEQLNKNKEIEDNTNHRIRACFNDKYNRNLERHLELIVNLTKPPVQKSIRFYLKALNKLNETPIENVLEEPEFSFNRGDQAFCDFWSALTNNINDIPYTKTPELITYITTNIQRYSFIEEDELGSGSRKKLIYSLLSILETMIPKNPKHRSTGRKIGIFKEISGWIFGEPGEEQKSILLLLGEPQRQVKGLYDLMLFRLFCCINRDNNFNNIHNSLSYNEDKNAITNGYVDKLVITQMRNISQSVFKIFKNNYIEKELNVFQEVEELGLQGLAGDFFPHIETNKKPDKLKDLALKTRTGILTFVIYQLGNSRLPMGIGCGYYDEIGSHDKGGIRTEITNYLLEICFNSSNKTGNYIYFIDYMIVNLNRSFFSTEGELDVKSIEERLCDVIEPGRLRNFWSSHKEKIKNFGALSMDRKISTNNFTTTYSEQLGIIFETLDKLVDHNETDNNEG